MFIDVPASLDTSRIDNPFSKYFTTFGYLFNVFSFVSPLFLGLPKTTPDAFRLDNEVLTLSCADPKTQIFDRSTNTIHDFKFGSYTFNHSASFNFSPRFKWIFNPTSSLSASEESSESTVAINVSNGSVEFTYDRDIQVSIIDMNGRKLNGGFFKNGTFRWNASHHPSGTYIISSSDFATKFILP